MVADGEVPSRVVAKHLGNYVAAMTSSRVLALATAPAHGAELVEHGEIRLVEGVGIDGDRHAGKLRQVTVICTGELDKAAAEHGTTIDAVTTRRNIVVDLDELPRTHGTVFTIGETELTVWRDCAPCSLMNDFFGDGAREALHLRAGISATVTRGGTVRIGDTMRFV